MNKLNERLTLIANISVVVGIIFLAVELSQNTNMMQAQIRDSIADKQMEALSWVSTNRELAQVLSEGRRGLDGLDEVSRTIYRWHFQAYLREYENSHYQYERGLFSPEEYEARVNTWRGAMSQPGNREVWASFRDRYSPSFRAEIDRIVLEAEEAQ